ncbi:hypothetical protein ES703_90160 [subsurface metagenome]
MEIGKTIEKLSDFCDRGCATLDEDFKNAVRIGKKGLTLLAYHPYFRLDDANLHLLLGAERRENEPERERAVKNLRNP